MDARIDTTSKNYVDIAIMMSHIFPESRTNIICLGYPTPSQWLCTRDKRPCYPVLSGISLCIYRYEISLLHDVGPFTDHGRF